MSMSRDPNKEELKPMSFPISSDPMYPAQAGILSWSRTYILPGPRVVRIEERYRKKVEHSQAQLWLPTNKVNGQISSRGMSAGVPENRKSYSFLSSVFWSLCSSDGSLTSPSSLTFLSMFSVSSKFHAANS